MPGSIDGLFWGCQIFVYSFFISFDFACSSDLTISILRTTNIHCITCKVTIAMELAQPGGKSAETNNSGSSYRAKCQDPRHLLGVYCLTGIKLRHCLFCETFDVSNELGLTFLYRQAYIQCNLDVNAAVRATAFHASTFNTCASLHTEDLSMIAMQRGWQFTLKKRRARAVPSQERTRTSARMVRAAGFRTWPCVAIDRPCTPCVLFCSRPTSSSHSSRCMR